MSALLLVLLACGADPAPDPASAPGAAADPSPDTPPAQGLPIDGEDCADPGSWARTGQPFVLTWCNGCHSAGRTGDDRYGAPEGVDFDTLADTVSWQARIQARVADGTMPPAGGPPADQIARLDHWFSCGAPGAEASLAGAAPALAPVVAADVVAVTAASTEVAGATAWLLREGDWRAMSFDDTRVVETWDVDGADAWLWSRELRDEDGVFLARWSWDPPLPVGRADDGTWTADVELTLEDADGGVVSGPQSWTFTQGPADPVDGWSIDDAPTRVLGLADDGAEEGWDRSPQFGLTARWSLDEDGAGLVYQQALEQDAGAFVQDFPLVEGDRRGGRIVELEVQP